MSCTRPLVRLALLALVPLAAARAADVEAPPADREPILRIDPGGPTAITTALAFSPDGKTLYAAGWDKLIRAWKLGDRGGFEPGRSLYRVPIGPGLDGAINALAVSPDGRWLAAAGNGTARQMSGFRTRGFMAPALGSRDPVQLRDVGTLYLFNTHDHTVRTLRGHQGVVRSLTFAARQDGTPVLLSLAVEEEKTNAVATHLTALLWDIDRTEPISRLWGLPLTALADRLPGTALWEDRGAMRAAFALHDGFLRIADLGAQPEVEKIRDLANSLGLAHLPQRRLLTAGDDGKRPRRARLRLWRDSAQGAPEREIDLGPGLARAVCPLSRQGNGTADLAAVVVWQPGNNEAPNRYHLHLVDLDARADRSILSRRRLWEARAARQPVLAASLRGGHLAVAGFPDHGIRVYSLRPLLDNEEVAPTILAANVRGFQHASFVRRGHDLGLLLRPGPAPEHEVPDWVFDFAGRRLSADAAGWKPAGPRLEVWQGKLLQNKTIAISRGDELVREIPLRSAEELSAWAVLPPGEGVATPLLAIATHQNGQPRLGLWELKSGRQVRELIGHQERLRSLAFTSDGRLLVSTAEDGTTCVWSLTDLATVLGRRGSLPGLTVAEAPGGVKVVKVEPAGSADGKLSGGDVIAGLVEKGRLRRLGSPHAFYEALFELRPGAEVVLRRGDPEGADDVRLIVGQGVDERKPLLSLFVTAAGKPESCDWIGWSALGPYESSSRKAERYLGWHFNTGDRQAPTRFAGADQYRKLYYREGLLEQFVQRGEVGSLDPPPLPAPVLAIRVEEGGLIRAARGPVPVTVARPDVRFRVSVLERPLSSLAELSWRLDSGAEHRLELDPPEGAVLAAPGPLSRGEHRFVVTARGRDNPLQPTTEVAIVRYQPPPPQLVQKDAGRQLFVRHESFPLAVAIKPGVAGEDVRVTILHRPPRGEARRHTQLIRAAEVHEGKLLHLEHTLDLLPGNNGIEVAASQGDVRDKNAGQEAAPVSLEVFYHFKARPPVIAFGRLTLGADRGKGEAVPVDTSRPLVVRVPQVRLEGSVKSDEEPLTEAGWDRGKDTPAARLSDFEPGKGRDFAFSQPVRLEPGAQTLRLRARTEHSEEAERRLTLTYQPTVPVVLRMTGPQHGDVFDEGTAETRQVPVHCRVMVPSGARDYEAVILVNGVPSPGAAAIDAREGTLTGTAVLRAGEESRVQVRLSNRWGAVGYSEEVAVRYVRPPRIRTLKHTPVPGRALIDLHAEVFSPPPPRRQAVRVTVNGQESAPARIEIERQKEGLWAVRAQGVPLDAGSREQEVRLSLSSTEAECRVPASLTIQSEKVLPPPTAEFLEPRQGILVGTARVPVRFQVRSEGALERVRLLVEGRPPQEIELGPQRRHELTQTREVELRAGLNRLRLEAVSVAGRLPAGPQLLLNYVPPPVQVVVDRLAEIGPGNASFQPVRNEQGEQTFKVGPGHVWLHGRIRWLDTAVRQAPESCKVHVYVNGFQQVPVRERRKPGTREAVFQAPILLNRDGKNRVSLVVASENPEEPPGEPAECLVSCNNPVTQQRLHLLVLSPRPSAERVEEKVLRALLARPDKAGRRPVFDEVRVAGTLTGPEVSREFIYPQLFFCGEEIAGRHMKALGTQVKPMNDVLMIYYEGGEAVSREGNFFETHPQAPGRDRFALPCDKLVEYLSDIPGAHLILLDVDRLPGTGQAARDKIASWKDDYPSARTNVVVMRTARRGEAARPGAPRLVPLLQQATQKEGRLKKVVPLVKKAVDAANDRALAFTYHLPAELADLPVAP